ncbi:MAG TPA: hypothetical protein VIG99_32410, partial [Myxococcaceae bacterium]
MRRLVHVALLALVASAPACTCKPDPGPPDGGGQDAGSDAGSLPDAGLSLTVAVFGSGTGTVTSAPAGISCKPTCAGAAAPGTVVTLSAAPTGGSTFMAWRGDCSGTSPTCAVNMDGARAVTAVFNPPSSLAGVYTWKYDNTRQGQNPSEATLTHANVTPSRF